MSRLTFYPLWRKNNPPTSRSRCNLPERTALVTESAAGCRHLFDIQSVTCSLYLVSFFPSNEMKCKQAGCPPCITAAADERIIKSLIFNFSFLSLFKKALSAARPQTDLHWLLFVQHFLCQFSISPSSSIPLFISSFQPPVKPLSGLPKLTSK